MKLLIVTPSFYPAEVYGGPIYTTHRLGQALAHRGLDVRVLTTDANAMTTLDIASAGQVVLGNLIVRYCHRVAFESLAPSLLIELWPQIAWADVVHLTAVYSFPILPTLVACRLQGKPLVWSPRGAFNRWRGSSRRRLKRVWDGFCRALVPPRLVFHVTSHREAIATNSIYPGKRAVIVPNGVDLLPPSRPPAVEGELHLLYLGRIHPIKGLEILLDGCRLLRDRGVAWRLTVAGAGDEAYVRGLTAKVQDLGLASLVKMVGPVFGEAKQDLLRRSHVVVVPSHSENFGMVVAEALAQGRAVIASRATPWEGLEERGCGLWIENSPEAIASAVERISRTDIAAMGAKGRDWMEQEFSWASIAERMESVYRSISD